VNRATRPGLHPQTLPPERIVPAAFSSTSTRLRCVGGDGALRIREISLAGTDLKLEFE
jgi:hypothetical protein